MMMKINTISTASLLAQSSTYLWLVTSMEPSIVRWAIKNIWRSDDILIESIEVGLRECLGSWAVTCRNSLNILLTCPRRLHRLLACRCLRETWVTSAILRNQSLWYLWLAHLSRDSFSRARCILLVNESLLVVRKDITLLLHFVFHVF